MWENEMGVTPIAYEERETFKIVVKKTPGKENLVWRPSQDTENNIKMDLRETETVNWIRAGELEVLTVV
jgi:hypothetical protein